MRIAGVVPAKGNSSRVPRKNLQEILGVPLFLVAAANLARVLDPGDVWVDTESVEIGELARACGFGWLRRPADLASNAADGNDLVAWELEALGQEVDVLVQHLPPMPDRGASLPPAPRPVRADRHRLAGRPGPGARGRPRPAGGLAAGAARPRAAGRRARGARGARGGGEMNARPPLPPVLAERVAELCSGLFSDALDRLGFRDRVVDGWVCNRPGARVLGRARTVRLETVETGDERISLGLHFLESVGPGEVLVVEGSREFAYFGELMTRLSLRLGIQGVVVDGLTRDLAYTHTAPLPTWARGYSPRDIKGRGRVAVVDVPVRVGHLEIGSGDLVFADGDGIVAVPREVEDELARRVAAKLAEEERIVAMIEAGASVDELLAEVHEF